MCRQPLLPQAVASYPVLVRQGDRPVSCMPRVLVRQLNSLCLRLLLHCSIVLNSLCLSLPFTTALLLTSAFLVHCQHVPTTHKCHAGCCVCRLLSNLNIQATLPSKLRQLNELVVLKLDGNR